jgi:hypothetical protein
MKDSEKAVEKKIGDWLKKTWVVGYSHFLNLYPLRFRKQPKIKVSGILYLYNSTDNRMTLPPSIHFRMFQRLLGNDFHPRVLLVMTMWEKVKAEQRETKLSTLTRNWGTNSAVVKHYGTKESAWDIVRTLLPLDGQNRQNVSIS